MSFDEKRGFAYCGLACAGCSAADCGGCRNRDQAATACSIRNCCEERGLDGCWACKDFPCDNKMFASTRVRAFCSALAADGVDRVIHYLARNNERGICYHRPGGLHGDYDDWTAEADILTLLREGRYPAPYTRCPVYQAGDLRLRLIETGDAPALLRCYSDLVTCERADSTNCTYGFYNDTLEGMIACITAWRKEYAQRTFIRWTILLKDEPIGTLEFFLSAADRRITGEPVQLSVLRIDLRSDHEDEALLGQLLDITLHKIAPMFQPEIIIAKAEESDVPRRLAYEAKGFARVNRDGVPAYYMALTC